MQTITFTGPPIKGVVSSIGEVLGHRPRRTVNAPCGLVCGRLPPAAPPPPHSYIITSELAGSLLTASDLNSADWLSRPALLLVFWDWQTLLYTIQAYLGASCQDLPKDARLGTTA